MTTYRITKYNPSYRDKDDAYTRKEWTSISDIGTTFGDSKISIQDYFITENKYINCILELLKLANISTLQVNVLESMHGCWKDGQMLSIPEIILFCRQCLRETIWGKLKGNNFFIHFGYDFYSYIGTDIPKDAVVQVCEANSLYCEKRKSPYQ